MPKNWFVDYEKSFLESLINKKRLARGCYDFIKPEQLDKIITKRMKADKVDKLSAIKLLIKDIREGATL